jgi:hypothetical protein
MDAPTNPIPGPAAFAEQTDDAAQAQAAILLSLGVQLRGDNISQFARSTAAGRPSDPLAATAPSAPVLESTDAATMEFPIPLLRPSPIRIHQVEALDQSASRFSVLIRPRAGLVDLAANLYEEPTHQNAAALIAAAKWAEHELVRVAAANAAMSIMTDTRRALAILENGLRSEDPLTRDVAATSLGRFMPEHPALRELTRAEASSRPDEASETSMLIHGTFARNNAWWQPIPPGDFHQYVRLNVWPDLYAKSDRYEWSGGYSDGARSLAATQLVRWLSDHNERGISLMTHSHGGSVAMLASWEPTVQIDKLVVLSCPVHPAKYSVNFGRVNKVVSVRVKMDLVLLADGSGSHFPDARYHEHVLPVWFNHSASHDPAVWQRYNVPAML